MPVNGMVTGRDFSLSFFDTRTNSVVDLGDVQAVNITAQKHDINSRPYNDVPRFGYITDGYRFSFQFVKTTAALEDFALDQAATFESGGNCPAGILNETVNYANGTVRSYQYPGFVFFLTDVADISREKAVPARGEGMASTKKRIS